MHLTLLAIKKCLLHFANVIMSRTHFGIKYIIAAAYFNVYTRRLIFVDNCAVKTTVKHVFLIMNTVVIAIVCNLTA